MIALIQLVRGGYAKKGEENGACLISAYRTEQRAAPNSHLSELVLDLAGYDGSPQPKMRLLIGHGTRATILEDTGHAIERFPAKG